jgi:hypothetical protein
MKAKLALETSPARVVVNAIFSKKEEYWPKNPELVLVCVKCGDRVGTLTHAQIKLLSESPKRICEKCLLK